MKSFAPITLALVALSTLSLASPAGAKGRGVEVSAFVERNLLEGSDPSDYNSAGPHHKGTRRHQKQATKFARRRANKKRQDCEDDNDDSGDDSGSNDSSYGSGTPSAAYPSSTPSYGSSSNGTGNGNKADEGTDDGSQSSDPPSATPSSGYGSSGSSSSGSESSSSSSSGSGSSGSSSSGSSSSGSSGSSSSIPQQLQGTVTGKATYYFQEGTTGSCGTVAQDSDKVVAVSQSIMTATNGALCGKSVQITNTGTGKSTTATIRDSCPKCKASELDLSQGAFDAIGAEAQGVLDIKFTIS